jgi:hypothetical protein
VIERRRADKEYFGADIMIQVRNYGSLDKDTGIIKQEEGENVERLAGGVINSTW